jgi:cysteine synthase A
MPEFTAMKELPRDILRRIGGTSLLALRRIGPANGARILRRRKRTAASRRAVRRRIYRRQHRRVARARLCGEGLSVPYIVTSDAFAREKLDHMKIVGARLTIVPSESGRMTGKLPRDLVEAARVIVATPDGEAPVPKVVAPCRRLTRN